MQCLAAVSVLAARVNVVKLDRLFGYLASTEEMVMSCKCRGEVSLTAYVDASWTTHDGYCFDDGRVRHGSVVDEAEEGQSLDRRLNPKS